MVRRLHFASFWLAGPWAMTSAAAPAAIMESTPAGRTDVRQAVAAALGKDVLIADDALTKSSLLTIERRIPRTLDGRVASGRILDPPETFRLVLEGDHCVLVHDRTGASYPLEHARCRASPADTDSAPPSRESRGKTDKRLL